MFRALADAIRFLTIFPIPEIWRGNSLKFERCALWFPVVGIFLGGLMTLVYWVAASVFPKNIAAWIVIVAGIIASGGLHLDGLADSSDGLFSAKPATDTLKIMKDSRIGTMGTLSLIVVLGIKGISLADLSSSDIALRTVLLMTVTGRCLLLLGISLGTPIPETIGIARSFLTHFKPSVSLLAILPAFTMGFALLRLSGIICVAAAIIGTTVFMTISRKRLNGINGDILGAMCELGEAIVLMTLACGPVRQLHQWRLPW